MHQTDHRKDTASNLLRDYDIDRSGGFSMPLLQGLLPVVLVDDTREFLVRTRPEYSCILAQAAVAAVYSCVGINAGLNPVLIEAFEDSLHPAGAATRMIYSEADIRSANQATINTQTGYERGQTNPLATLLTGTHTALYSGWIMWDPGTTVVSPPDLFEPGFVLRPGESLWLEGDTVNVAIRANLRYREIQYQLTPNPPDLA